jgi:hypothetical protein
LKDVSPIVIETNEIVGAVDRQLTVVVVMAVETETFAETAVIIEAPG